MINRLNVRVFRADTDDRLIEEKISVPRDNLDFSPKDLLFIGQKVDARVGDIIEIFGKFMMFLPKVTITVISLDLFDYYSVLTREERQQIVDDLSKKADEQME